MTNTEGTQALKNVEKEEKTMEQRTRINKSYDAETVEAYRGVIERILLPRFSVWFSSLGEEGEKAGLPGKVIAEKCGYDEGGPTALLFTGFAEGIMAAIGDSMDLGLLRKPDHSSNDFGS